MAKSMYYYLRQAWKKPDKETLRKRMISRRASGTFTKVDKPLRLDKARSLGYKDKKGFVIVRVKLKRGSHKRKRPNKGRRSKRLHTKKNLKMSYQWIAESRAQKKYSNLEVLNSYFVGKDGQHYFYEVILIDPEKPEIKTDKNLKWISSKKNKKRALRGLTSAAKKSRGLKASKSKSHKVRPSVRSGGRKGK